MGQNRFKKLSKFQNFQNVQNYFDLAKRGKNE